MIPDIFSFCKYNKANYVVIVLIHNTLTPTIYLELTDNYCTLHTPSH